MIRLQYILLYKFNNKLAQQSNKIKKILINHAGNERVMSFIQVQFQNQDIVRTHSSEGPTPAWNQTLIIPFTAPRGDFSPEVWIFLISLDLFFC